MRLLFFIATAGSVLSFVAGFFALSRRKSTVKRDRVSLLAIFALLCFMLGLGTLASAFFISAPNLESAYFWYDKFSFTWYLSPPLFFLLALRVARGRHDLIWSWAVLIPGLVLSVIQTVIPRAVVASIGKTHLGWHVFYDFSSFWHWLNVANYSLAILAASVFLTAAVLFSKDKRAALQSRAILIAIAPTYLGAIFLGLVVRFFGFEALPPMLPVFIPVLVVGLLVALFRYDILNLGSFTDSDILFSGLSDVLVVCDSHGYIIDTNLGGSRHRGGRAADDLNGKNIAWLFPDIEFADVWLREMIQPGTKEIETRFSFEPGAERLALVSVRRLGSDRGLGLGYLLSIHDLSVEKRLESEIEQRLGASRALRLSEERFSRLFRFNPAGMALVDREFGQIRDVNEAFLRIGGYDADDLGSLRIDHLFSEDDNSIFYSMLSSIQESGSASSAEMRVIRSDGQELWCLVGISLLDVDAQSLLLLTLQDITELFQLRNELDKTQRLESIGLLAGGLAHDFNNILTAILGNVSLARMSVDEKSEVWELLGNAETSCFRARDLSYQLLTFSKGGSPRMESMELLPVVRESVRMAVAGTSVLVNIQTEPDIPNVRADSGQIVQVISNLVINAVQAMAENGVLKVKLGRERVESGSIIGRRPELANLDPGDYVTVSFEDNGPGVSPGLRTRIFEPYITTKAKGSGLGLSICYSIVKRHGGSIFADAAPSGGSLFTVYLPGCSDIASVKERIKIQRGKGRVLVMDDELTIRVTAMRMLERLGYEAHAAADGKEALQQFEKAGNEGKGFSVAILDLTIPGGMGGVETAKALRERDPGVVLYVSSGYSDVPVLSDYMGYGFDGVIAKPYGIEELSERLSGAISGAVDERT